MKLGEKGDREATGNMRRTEVCVWGAPQGLLDTLAGGSVKGSRPGLQRGRLPPTVPQELRWAHFAARGPRAPDSCSRLS